MNAKSTILQLSGKVLPDLYRPPAGVLFPYGHIVCDTAPLHVRCLYDVPSIAKFKSDLDALCRRRRPLQLTELDDLPRSRQSKESAQRFLLSFDDGMREVYEVIVPILRERGLPAILFLNSATIDNKSMMWRNKVSLLLERARKWTGAIPEQISKRPGKSLFAKINGLRYSDEGLIDELAVLFEVDFEEYLRTHRPYMTREEVQDLARWGFEIGAHSDTHPLFTELEPAEQERQITASVNFVRSLGIPCRTFAFPFNDNGVSKALFRQMADQNIILAFGTSEGRVDQIAFSFQRFAFDGANAHVPFQGMLDQLSAKSLLRRLSGTDAILRN